MKLSVLITTYNLEKYVAETLDSVLMQKTDFSYEILIGDDGSSDGTLDILKDYERRYPNQIHIYVMDRDAGKKYNRIERASKNRINLLSHAMGDYLIFLDGDDVYSDSNKIQKQVDILDAPQNQDCVACAHNTWLYWNENKKELINSYTRSFKVVGGSYWRDCMYFHSDTVMFRNVYRDGFPKTIHPAYYDDNIIVYALLEYGKIIYIPDAMVLYRQIENSSWNSVDQVEKNLINLMDWDIERQINPTYRKESVIRHMYNIFYVWRWRKKIPVKIREQYQAQIEKDNLIMADRWLNYQNQNMRTRCGMTLWLVGQLVRFTGNKIRKSVLHR